MRALLTHDSLVQRFWGMSDLDFDRRNLFPPPPEIVAYVERLAANYVGDDRRTTQRRAVTVPVTVIPVNQDLEPTGEAFMAISRDISTDGMSFIHTRNVNDEYLALELVSRDGGDEMQVLMKVLRCETVGRFYEVAGRFVKKLT